MKVQPRKLVIYSCSYIGHPLQATEVDESSEVKVLVRSASNLSGRSIKRNLLHRNATTLIALG